MRHFLPRFCVLLIIGILVSTVLSAQDDTTNPTSVDPKLIEWEKATIPREYTIADVKITGTKFLDTAIVYSIANLVPGDKFIHPGNDIFAKSIANLWRQKFFSNIRIYVTRIEGDKVWIEISLQERPR